MLTQAERLRLNGEMSSMAQEWAEHLALTGKLEHSNKRYRGQPVGENVTAKTGTGSVDYTGQSSRSLDAGYNWSCAGQWDSHGITVGTGIVFE